MATSETEIANSALILVGADRINALSEDNQRARLCNEEYPKELRALLYSHPWNFAIKRVQLASVVAAPEFGYDRKFQIPSDCLRVLAIDSEGEKYEIENGYVHCNEATLKIKYISSSVTPIQFSMAFEDALAHRLAAKIAYALTQSSTLTDALYKKADEKESLARTYDAQEGQGLASVVADDWFNARF